MPKEGGASPADKTSSRFTHTQFGAATSMLIMQYTFLKEELHL